MGVNFNNQNKKCLISGCERNAVTRGLCNMHYERKRKNNDFKKEVVV